MWFTILAGLAIILFLIWYNFYSNNARIRKMTAHLSSPRAYPLIGHALEFGTSSDQILQAYLRIADQHGTVVPVWIGPEVYIVLSDIQDLEPIFSSNKLIDKAHVYTLLDSWLGNGLLSSTGDLWRKHRRILTPTFHFKILEQFIEVFNSNSDILVDKFKSEVGKPGVNVIDNLALCALDIISESSMGTKVNAQMDKDNKFVTAINFIALGVLQRALRPWLFPDIIFNISPLGRKYNKHLEVVHSFIDEVIQTKRKQRVESKNMESIEREDLVFGQKRRLAFLDTLLDYNDNGVGLTDTVIRNEVNTFMFAGHDTTSNAISFVLYALMKYPDVQERVHKEMLEIFENRSAKPTYQDLQNMKYLDSVIKETMRVYPIVPYVGRKISEDVTLPSGVTLPAGASVTLLLYKLHHNGKLFPDPEVFNPDRFNADESTGRHPFAFCPFSAGPRNCIGQRFALLETKAVVSAVVRNFKLLPPIGYPDIVLGSELVLTSITGFYIKLENRSKL